MAPDAYAFEIGSYDAAVRKASVETICIVRPSRGHLHGPLPHVQVFALGARSPAASIDVATAPGRARARAPLP